MSVYLLPSCFVCLLSYGIFHLPLCSVPSQSVWLPLSQIILSVCFCATLPVIHSKDILWFPSYSILACSQCPSPKFTVVFLQVLHTFSGYSVFRLLVRIHVQLYFYDEGCHSRVDEDSRDIMLCRLVCKYQSTWHLFCED